MKKITVRMGDAVHADLQAQAAAAGISMEAYIRGLIVEKPYDPQLLTRLVRPVLTKWQPTAWRPTLAAKTIRDASGRRQ